MPDLPEPGKALTADIWPHPLTAEGRDQQTLMVAPGTTVADVVRRCRPSALPMAAVLEGEYIPRSQWDQTPVVSGQTLTLRATIHGGDDSDPLQIVLAIVIVVAALYAPYLLPSLTGFQVALVQAGILITGGLISNALFAPSLPDAPGAAGQADAIFSLAGGANRPRPNEPLLLVLGEHRVFPDLKSREYTQFRANDQYLLQGFDWGIGAPIISDLRLGDTPIANFQAIALETMPPGQPLTLLHGHVDTIAGADLENHVVAGRGFAAAGVDWLTGYPNGEPPVVYTQATQPDPAAAGWLVRESSPDTIAIEVDFVGQQVRYTHQATTASRSVTVLILISGILADGSKWRQTVRQAITGQNATPVRRTIRIETPEAGQYTIRVARASAPNTATRTVDRLSCSALRSFQADTADATVSTRTGVEIRATGQLNGRLDRLNGLVRQPIDNWVPAALAWRAVPDGNPEQNYSNPAALFRAYVKGWRSSTGQQIAGVGLPDSRIDLDGLAQWHVWCEAQSLTCKLVLDRPESHSSVLTVIARCGRAGISFQSGRLGVVYDDGDRLPTAAVLPGNIIAESFVVTWAGERGATEIVGKYLDETRDYEYAPVRKVVPGQVAAQSAQVTLRGVTNASQAKREVNLTAARQAYHRRRFAWDMGPEGLAIGRGDVVWISHALIDGGVAGRLISGNRDLITLSQPVTLTGVQDMLLLRLRNGALHSTAVTRGDPGAGETAYLRLTDRLNAADSADAEGEPGDILWRFYAGATPPKKARVIAVEAAGENRLSFTAIDNDPRYYAADVDNINAVLPRGQPDLPVVESIEVYEAYLGLEVIELTAIATVSGDWRGGVVRYWYDGEDPRTVATLGAGETQATWVIPRAGTGWVSVVPGSAAAPVGTSAQVAVITITTGSLGLPPTLTAVPVGPDSIDYSWVPSEPRALTYELQCQRATEPAGTWSWSRYFFGGDHVFRHSFLPPETGYLCRIRAFYLVGGWGPWSAIAQATTSEALFPAPRNFRDSTSSETEIVWRWDPVPGAAAYLLQGWLATGAGGRGLAFSVVVVGATTATASALTAGTKYAAHVAAVAPGYLDDDTQGDGDSVDDDEIGRWSYIATAATEGTAPAGTIDGTSLALSVRPVDNDSLQYNWVPVTGALEYEIQYVLSSLHATPQTVSVSAPAQRHVVNGLAAATTYIAQIRARNASGWGAWSTLDVSGTTYAAGLLSAPVDLSTAARIATSITLT